jgi:hypothetical protein
VCKGVATHQATAARMDPSDKNTVTNALDERE